MKKLFRIILCGCIFISCIFPVLAADGVPLEVMEATKSVVRILAEHRKNSVTGSGFVIKNDDTEVLIVTNDHVVAGNPGRISVWVGQNELVEAEIVFTASQKDLCVLRLSEPVDMEPLKLSEEDPQHGAAIYVVGYPGAGDVLSDTEAHTSESVTITDGIISAIRNFTIEKGAAPVKLLQVNAAINSGNSGGPLFNTVGEVIGVNTYKVNVDSQGVFGSVDISELWDLLEQHNIELAAETMSTEETTVPTETAEPVVEEETERTPIFLLFAVVAAVILLCVFAIVSRKKKIIPKRIFRKVQSIALKQHMEQYPAGLGIGSAVSLLLPVAIQLRNLHNDGKLHLQICPENIRIGERGTFLAEPSGQETGRFNNGFAAPEIYRGAGFGITSDVYSFAALLLYAATGKVPANSLQPEVLEHDFALLDNADFARILRSAMAAGTADRIQSMQELIYSIAVYNVPDKALNTEQPGKTEVPDLPAEENTVLVMETERESRPKEKTPENQTAGNSIQQWKVWLAAQVHAFGEYSVRTKTLVFILLIVILVEFFVFIGLIPRLIRRSDADSAPETTYVSENTLPAEDPVIETEPAAAESPQEEQYRQAEKLLADGETAKAAIAFGKLAGYKDARERSFALWDEIAVRETIAVGNYHTLGLKDDGTVLVAGKNIRHVGSAHRKEVFPMPQDQGQCDVSEWNDIIAVGAGATCSVALRKNGTVVGTGLLGLDESGEIWKEIESWQDIVSITVGGGVIGLKLDGTVVSTSLDLSDWSDIVAISSGAVTVGLKADGTVLATGNNQYKHNCNVEQWTDIMAIYAGNSSTSGKFWTIGLKSDGTVVATGDNSDGQCNVEGWTDIRSVSISSRENHTTYGIKDDGTVLCAGKQSSWYNAGKWKDIVCIVAGRNHAVGLKYDGTLVATGNTEFDRCDVSGWNDIKLPK